MLFVWIVFFTEIELLFHKRVNVWLSQTEVKVGPFPEIQIATKS